MKVNIDICKMHLKLFYASNEDYVITNTVLQVLKEEKVILSYELFDGEYEIKFLNKEDKNFILENIKDFINKNSIGYKFSMEILKDEGILYL